MGPQRYSPEFKQAVVEELLAGGQASGAALPRARHRHFHAAPVARAVRAVGCGGRERRGGQGRHRTGGQDRRAGAHRRSAHGGEYGPKKGLAASAVPLAVTHALIEELKAMVPVRQLCAILGVSRSWYYAAPEAGPAEADVALRDAIERVVLRFPGYGYRRVTKPLQRGAGRSTTSGPCGSCARRPCSATSSGAGVPRQTRGTA